MGGNWLGGYARNYRGEDGRTAGTAAAVDAVLAGIIALTGLAVVRTARTRSRIVAGPLAMRAAGSRGANRGEQATGQSQNRTQG